MRRSIRFTRAAGLALATLGVLVTSCRYVREEKLPETGATLEGTVKYGGETLQFAMIQVLGPDGMANGTIGEDGRYKVENVPLGEVRIGVNTSAAQGEFQSKMMAGGAYKGPEAKGKGKVVGLKFIQVPEKYSNPETSGLKTTINQGPNTYDIEIPR